MGKSLKYIIIYSRQDADPNLFGFSIMESKKASQYMKAVNLLAEESLPVSVAEMFQDVIYDSEDFIKMKLNATDLSVLEKIFNLEDEEEFVGIFPDAIADAYDNGLTEESDEDYDE